MFSVLLIDDDPDEQIILNRILRHLTHGQFKLTYVRWVFKAIDLIREEAFDLILLDNRIGPKLTAQTNVSRFEEPTSRDKLVIYSDNTDPLYLSDPRILGVYKVVNKVDVLGFLRYEVNARWKTTIKPTVKELDQGSSTRSDTLD